MDKGLVYEIIIYILSIVAAIFFITSCASEYWDSRQGIVEVENSTSTPRLHPTTATTVPTTLVPTNATLVNATSAAPFSNATNATSISTLPLTTPIANVLAFQSHIKLHAEFTTGLWKKCTKFNDPLTKKLSLDDRCDEYSNTEVDAVRALYIVGIIALFFALIGLCALFCKKSKRVGAVVVVGTALGAFFIALALIVYVATEKKSEADLKWGYILAWVAIILEVINVLIMFIAKFTLHHYKQVV